MLRLVLGGAALLWAAVEAPSATAADEGAGIIDTHAHIARNGSRRTPPFPSLATSAMKAMDEAGIRLTILLPPPFPPAHDGVYGLSELRAVHAAHPSRFAFVAGGESLNPMLQRSKAGETTPQQIASFLKEAARIADAGAAGFGELTAEHFSFNAGHPYESLRPDHPLLLALADFAAERGLPIDLHMEAVPSDMPMPPRRQGGNNPAELKANLDGFERLLDHNRRARIVWAHAGWDNTSRRTIPLMKRLLGVHPNLFMSIKISKVGGAPASNPLNDDNSLKAEWLEMLQAFPDRFVIGSDQFYDSDLERLTNSSTLLRQLPAELAAKIGRTNALGVYRLQPR